jgi:Tfp pilus assembly protein PilW
MSNIHRGFTLIELLLYTAISATLLLAISIFLSMLLQSQTKNQTIVEVEQQGTMAMQIITQTIRNATAINSPAQGTSASLLSENVLDISKSPTIFDLLSGVLRIKEGAGSAISLTNNRVAVSNLTFQNLSRPGTPGTIRIQFTVSYINLGGRNEYNYTKTFLGSASIR